MKNVVFTIAREYGSGGRTIGELLAKTLNIPFYDKELLKLASEDSGINEGLFMDADEKVKHKSLFSIAKNAYNGELITPEQGDIFTSNQNLFNYQAKIIKQLATEQSCVIMGRCADFILKENTNVVSVFIHAPKSFCIEKASEKHSLSEKELEKLIKKIDAYRSEYYKYYTKREWTDARNYDLSLNASKLGFELCVKEIISYTQVRFQHQE